MAALTTTNLRDRAKERFRDPSNYVVTDAQWLSYLNEAYQEVNSREMRWPWHFTQVSVSVTPTNFSGHLLDADADIIAVTEVYNVTDGYPLAQIDGYTEAAKYYDIGVSTGSPEVYWFDGISLQIYPNPEATKTFFVNAWASAVDLTTSGANPLWPNRYRRALIEFALSRAYEDDGNMDWANAHRQVGDAIVDRMTHALLGEPRTEAYPTVIDNMWA